MGAMPATGLAHVATASFVASRAAPSGGFAVALAGGVAIARAAERFGLRRGWGAALAAMLQSVAIMGPPRFGVPLTQAISAPVLGRMQARGHGTVAQAAAAAGIRVVHNALGAAFAIFVLVGVDAYTGTYDRLLGWLPILPSGETGALIATVLSLLGWAVFASTIQALVYRRGLMRWPADPPDPGEPVETLERGAHPPDARPRSRSPSCSPGRRGRCSAPSRCGSRRPGSSHAATPRSSEPG
jgi:hypothetical protein